MNQKKKLLCEINHQFNHNLRRTRENVVLLIKFSGQTRKHINLMINVNLRRKARTLKRTPLIREHENSQEGPKSLLGDFQQRPRVRRNETQRKFNMQEQSECDRERGGSGGCGF